MVRLHVFLSVTYVTLYVLYDVKEGDHMGAYQYAPDEILKKVLFGGLDVSPQVSFLDIILDRDISICNKISILHITEMSYKNERKQEWDRYFLFKLNFVLKNKCN